MDDKVKTNESSFNLYELSPISQNSPENQVEGKTIVFDESPELSNMDYGHKYQNNKDENCMNSEDVFCTASSQTGFENFLQLKSEVQRSTQENKRLETEPEKLRKEYNVSKQRLGQFEREIFKLHEDNETFQKERVGGECDQGIRLEEQRASLEAKKSGLGSQNAPDLLESVESSENVDRLQKHHNKLAEEPYTQPTRGQKLTGATEELQGNLLCLEEIDVLKTEYQKSPVNNNGIEKLVSNRENSESNGDSVLEIYNMKCAFAKQHDAVHSRQNHESPQRECSLEHNNLDERNISLRNTVSNMQEKMSSVTYETCNLLIEEDSARNHLSGQPGSMQEKMTSLQLDVQEKAKTVQVPKKQIEELQQALEESECYNSLIRNKQEKWVEEHDVTNTRSKTLEVELANVQQENQKLRKELSAKATDLKNLQGMFSSLGKEKEVMAKELALKVRVLADTEEHLNDLKEQNMTLTNKLESYAREHKSKTRTMQGTITLLQNRNKSLADQLLKSSEGCRALKRKLKELQETDKGLKRETANLKSSIQNREKFIHVLEAERKALQNEVTWGKERLHILQEKCKWFKEETETATKEDLSKLNGQKSFIDEIVLLEQRLLHFMEEMTCFKTESERRDKECQELKEEITRLQIKHVDKESKQLMNEVQEIAQKKEKGSLLLNSSVHNLKQENQLVECQLYNMCSESEGANRRIASIEEQLLLLENTNTNLEEQILSRNNSIKRLKDASDVKACEKENDKAHMSDETDFTNQASGKSNVIQKENGASSMEQEKKVLVSKISSLVNQIMRLHHVVNDLKISRQYSSEVPLTDHDNLHGLDVEVKELGMTNSNLQNEREFLNIHDQGLYKQLVGSKQLLEEIEHHISRLAYERDGLVLDVSHKADRTSELEKQLVSLQKEISAKTDEINLLVSMGSQGKKKRIEVPHQDRMEQITQLEDLIRKLQKESDGLKQENMNLKAECHKNREKCSFLEKCLQAIQKELSKANENVKLREKGHIILQEENSWIKNSISEAIAITQTVGQEIQALASKNSSLRNEVSIKAEEFGKINEELQRQLDELQRENLLLNNASKADGTRIHELQSEVDKLETQLKMLRDENEKQRIVLSDSAEEKRDAIRQLCFALDHLKDRNTHLQRILSSILNYNRNKASTTPTTTF